MAQYIIDNLPAPIDFQTTDLIKRTLQNAKNLLMCHMGEVPYDRLRGFDPQLYHLPIGQLREELVPELDRLMMWEPDVQVVDAEASLTEDMDIYIKVTLEITIDESAEGG